MLNNKIRNTIGGFALGVMTGSMLTAGTILLATPAKADPANEIATMVCSSLDNNPTVANVTAIITDLVRAGATYYQAGQIVGISVTSYCTRNIPVVQDFIDTYSPDSNASFNNKIGGKIA